MTTKALAELLAALSEYDDYKSPRLKAAMNSALEAIADALQAAPALRSDPAAGDVPVAGWQWSPLSSAASMEVLVRQSDHRAAIASLQHQLAEANAVRLILQQEIAKLQEEVTQLQLRLKAS